MTDSLPILELPSVNLDRLVAGDPDERRTLADAITGPGVFGLHQQRISAIDFARWRSLAAAWFASPPVASASVEANFTGYVSYRSGRIAPSDVNPISRPDLYEALLFKRSTLEDPPDWIDDEPLLLAAGHLFEAKRELAAMVRDQVPLAIQADIDPSEFVAAFANGGECTLRLNHYPALNADHPAGDRMAPHSDSGFMTIMEPSPSGGLEVLLQNGWHAATAAPGDLIVNVGQTLQRWTGGRANAVVHRVQARPAEPRITTPFFYSPDRSAMIRPIAGPGGSQEPAFRFGDFQDSYMGKNLPDAGVGVDPRPLPEADLPDSV